MFEARLARYRNKARTKLPSQEAAEAALRVNQRVVGPAVRLCFPEDIRLPGADDRTSNAPPFDLLDSAVIYDSAKGSITLSGVGGKAVIDPRSCMVQVAEHFVAATQRESCGECTFCRVGGRRALEILGRIRNGQGAIEHIDTLQELGEALGQASQCELGKTAGKILLMTLGQFRIQYETHIARRRCPAGKCGLASGDNRSGTGQARDVP